MSRNGGTESLRVRRSNLPLVARYQDRSRYVRKGA